MKNWWKQSFLLVMKIMKSYHEKFTPILKLFFCLKLLKHMLFWTASLLEFFSIERVMKFI